MPNPKRFRKLDDREYISGPIVYWMSRDQCIHNNWALLYAQKKAFQYKVLMFVVFFDTPFFRCNKTTISIYERQFHLENISFCRSNFDGK